MRLNSFQRKQGNIALNMLIRRNTIFSLFTLIFISVTFVQENCLIVACGVGKGSYTNREFPPFTKYQQKPDEDEESSLASGPFSHKIRIGTDEFKKKIVRFFDTNVIFRDDEGNGADRYMTKRCQKALKRLAQYVRVKWNNRVKVRVIEAWDEDGEHYPRSLHYEGRAIDITTSDRDRRKYGVLASLAYFKAEFDWVTLLDGHVHVSCKKDDAIEERNSCFPGSATVTLDNGETKAMYQLKIGDKVLAQSESGGLVYSKVIMFMDNKPHSVVNSYVQIETEKPKRMIQLTRKHLIIKSENAESFEAIFAEKVQRGDFVKVLSSNGSSLVTARVENVSLQRNHGAFAPLTAEGTILVNGILASCYALTEDQKTAHASFLPWRVINGYVNQISNVQIGEHWYVAILRTINRFFGLLPEVYII